MNITIFITLYPTIKKKNIRRHTKRKIKNISPKSKTPSVQY